MYPMFHQYAPYAPYADHPSAWLVIGPIIMVLFWAGVVALIIALVRRSRIHPGHHDQPAQNNALAILQERFAKGDITKEQYEEMKKVLSK